MGIPAFYKHLMRTVTGLTKRVREKAPDLLALDLNCAIYHCVRLQQQQTPYTVVRRLEFERAVVERTIAYIKQLDKHVGARSVYVAVDGVAPMAKLKQQRMRRFKSAQTAEEEARIKATVLRTAATATTATTTTATAATATTATTATTKDRWDTNAITPGTEFMEQLTEALYAFQAKHAERVVVSPADEPGEGEQKLMAHVRLHSIKDTVVYGLDADLIVLALYHHAVHGATVDLLREETEFGGGVKVDALGAEQFLYLDTTHLADALHGTYGAGKSRTEFLVDFVGAMSLQGNDFVPHGMGLTIKQEGIERVLEILQTVKTPLVQVEDKGRATYRMETLRLLVDRLAAEEEAQILLYSRKKLTARGGMGSTELDRALAQYQDQPLEWKAEEALVSRVLTTNAKTNTNTNNGGPRFQMRPEWASRYDELALEGTGPHVASAVYCEALGWTLAYYSGASVDSEWQYPWSLPPRFASIQSHLRTLTAIPIPSTARPSLTPRQQLAMVLPASSYPLLPAEYKAICSRNPWAFPVAWPVQSLGRRYLWECEPILPIVVPSQIRAWIEEMEDP